MNNLKIIIDHAHLSKLRPLTVYWVGRGNLKKVYSYDIIIPKQHKIEKVGKRIDENMKKSESLFIEDKKSGHVIDLLK